ncbi:hypothetical protein HZA57_00200 [Candidatus Poribacteria bacterium]|nr:hypothetical protein [Candidatus Poribacteria bacterium]
MGPRAIMMTLLAVCLVALGRADSVFMLDGRQISNAQIDSFLLTSDNMVFQARLIENGAAGETLYPVLGRQVRTINFGEQGVPGRTATVVTVQGQTFPDATVISCGGTPHGLAFSIRPPGQAAAEPLVVEATSISRIFFGATVAVTLPTPRPTPAEDEWGDETSWDMAEPDSGQGDPAGETPPVGGISEDSADGSESFDESDFEDADYSSFNPPQSGLAVRILGFTIGAVAFGISFLAGAIIGGTFLFWSSRLEGISDFPWWKGVVTAILMAIFPPLFLLLCTRFIPWFGFWIGWIAMYFSGRAILQGVLEVLEDKVNSVIFSYYVIQIGALALAAKFLG